MLIYSSAEWNAHIRIQRLLGQIWLATLAGVLPRRHVRITVVVGLRLKSRLAGTWEYLIVKNV